MTDKDKELENLEKGNERMQLLNKELRSKIKEQEIKINSLEWQVKELIDIPSEAGVCPSFIPRKKIERLIKDIEWETKIKLSKEATYNRIGGSADTEENKHFRWAWKYATKHALKPFKELLDEKPKLVIGDKAFRVISVDPIERTPADKVNSEKPSGKIIKKFEMWPTGSICIELNKHIETGEERERFLKELEKHMDEAKK